MATQTPVEARSRGTPPATPHVIVVGGGLVGAAAALGLARLNYQVTLIDRQAPQVQRGRLGIDIRNVALNPQSQALLAELGCWQEASAQPYTGMYVWEQWGQGALQFDAADVARNELGWLAEMSPLHLSLWQACEAQLHVVTGTVAGLHINAGVRVDIDAGDSIDGDFLIAADGGNSLVRRLLNLAVDEFPVDQVALATAVQCEHPHGGIARQRFLVDGPLALLPSPRPDVVSVVWSQSAGNASRRLALSDTDFLADITRASEACCGQVTAVDQRLTFPLKQQRALQLLHNDCVLFLGDAARVIHPLAGLGVNLGFEDVLQLLQLARQTRQWRGASLWPAYLRRRQARSRQMIAMLGVIKSLYGTPDPALGLVRNLGVGWLNRIPAAKAQLMREAMGLGPLSKVSVGVE